MWVASRAVARSTERTTAWPRALHALVLVVEQAVGHHEGGGQHAADVVAQGRGVAAIGLELGERTGLAGVVGHGLAAEGRVHDQGERGGGRDRGEQEGQPGAGEREGRPGGAEREHAGQGGEGAGALDGRDDHHPDANTRAPPGFRAWAGARPFIDGGRLRWV